MSVRARKTAAVSGIIAIIALVIVVVVFINSMNVGGCTSSVEYVNDVKYNDAPASLPLLGPGCTAEIYVTYFLGTSVPENLSQLSPIYKVSAYDLNVSLVTDGEVVVNSSLLSGPSLTNVNTTVMYTITASNNAFGTYILGVHGSWCPGIFFMVGSRIESVTISMIPITHGCSPSAVAMTEVKGVRIIPNEAELPVG
jgi:hypothetical protein